MSSGKFLPLAYHQNTWKDFSDANISIATHALHYGIGAFGWMRAIVNPENTKEILLFRLDEHAKRLSNSAKLLGYEISAEKITTTITEFIQKNKPTKPTYIRPFVYTSDLDLSPRLHDIEFDFLIYGVEMGDYLDASGIRCTVSSWQRQSDASFPLRGKISGAYITSALAKSEAIKRGFDEAILMNAAGKVSEGSAMNIFIVRNGVIKTPAVSEDILEWITRMSVIEIAKDLGYRVEECQIDKSELFIADEVFFSGTAAKITPVKQIEGYKLSENREISNQIKAVFDDIVSGKNPKYANWITRITLWL